MQTSDPGSITEQQDARSAPLATSEELWAILNAVQDGITVQAPDGRLLWANDAAARVIGFGSAAELVGARVEDITAAFEVLDEAGNLLSLSDLPGRRALEGEEPEEVILRYRVRATGGELVSAVKATPIFDDTGRVRFAVNVFRDMTEQQRTLDELKRSQARLSLISAVSPKLLAAAIDYAGVLEAVADVLVPALADYCSILEVAPDGSLRRAVNRHADRSKDDLVRRLLEYPVGDRTSQLQTALRERRPLHYPEIPEDLLRQAAVDDEHYDLIRQIGMRSVIAVPLIGRGKVVGALTLVAAESGRTYTESDVTLVEDISRRAALAIDNARLYEERSNVARTLQKSLLPPELPVVPGVELAARYLPAAEEIGGDFYDVFPMIGNRWMIVLGDVCGKGPEAAALTSMIRFTIRAAAIHWNTATEILTDVNRGLLPQVPPGRFCTAACAIVEPLDGRVRLTVAVAGHPLPLFVSSNDGVNRVGTEGVLLGVLPEVSVTETQVVLEPGDAIAFFTDGALNEPDPHRLTAESRLAAALERSRGGDAMELARAVETEALRTRRPGREDDVAVLGARAI